MFLPFMTIWKCLLILTSYSVTIMLTIANIDKPPVFPTTPTGNGP